MQSKDLYIKELNKFDNLDNYLEMVNDFENVKSIQGLSSEILSKEDLINTITNYNGYLFGLFNKNDEHVGNIGLTSINKILRSCSLGILMSRKFQRKGYAYMGMKLVLKFAFENIKLNRVFLGVVEWNLAAIKLYEKIGFKYEGLQREAFHNDGKFYGLKMYSILKNEFES